MKAFNKLQNWGNRHHPVALDILRIALGLFLLLKGYTFLNNMAYLKWVLFTQTFADLSPYAISILVFYVIFIHMTGGVLITLGILTRLACILQLPVIIGAVFTVNIFKSAVNSEMWLSALTGLLLTVFIIIGSGPWSLDHYLTNYKEK